MADYRAEPVTTADSIRAGLGGTLESYKMIGVRTADGVWITWTVTGSPDFTGTLAPAPVTAGTVSVSK